MGSVGSIFLSRYGWHSVFIFHGLMALLWAYIWRFWLLLPEYQQRRQQFALGSIKMVEASGFERASLVSVPWGVFARHPAVWCVVLMRQHYCNLVFVHCPSILFEQVSMYLLVSFCVEVLVQLLQ